MRGRTSRYRRMILVMYEPCYDGGRGEKAWGMRDEA
jgi:hypothetical protein